MSNAAILIIGDTLSTLKPSGDSSLALAEAALTMGYGVFWCEPSDVGILGADVVVARTSRIVSVGSGNAGVEFHWEPGAGLTDLRQFKQVWVRKDPPFDESYKTLCWILASQATVPVVNRPELLLAHHEKALQFRARSEGVLRDHEIVPSCVASALPLAEAFLSEYGASARGFLEGLSEVVPGLSEQGPLTWIVKPWLGHGGHGVQLFTDEAKVLSFLRESFAQAESGASAERTWILQPYLPQIKTKGDRRVFIVRGEVVCVFVRLPAEGRIAANLAQGGRAVLEPLTDAQRSVVERIAPWLDECGIAIAGVDLIDAFVGEINITSPTGLRTYEHLTGRNVARRAAELLLGNG
jgi:glutathione synthase